MASPPSESGPAEPPALDAGPLSLVRGTASAEELDALRHALARRGLAHWLRSWRAGRRRALARHPERLGDR